MKKTMLTTIAAVLFSTAVIAAPHGFDARHHSGPQGFNNPAPSSVAEVLKNGRDDQIVTLRGRLTRHLHKDHYEFTDQAGNTIEVELDDDKNWNHIAKDQLIDITGEIDKDFTRMTIDVRRAVPVVQN